MLGFTPIAEIPFATYQVDLSISAFFTGVSSNTVTEAVYSYGTGNFVLPTSYGPTLVSNILTDAKAIVAIGSVITEPVYNEVTPKGEARAIYPSFLITGVTSSLSHIATVNKNLQQVYATLRYPSVYPRGKAVTSVVTTSSIIEATNVTLSTMVNISPSSLLAYLYQHNVSVDASSFDYTSYVDSYDRSRTIYLLSEGINRIVHVIPDNNVVYIPQQPNNRVVFVTH
jgi:fructose-specific phosphotransferase system IIC component